METATPLRILVVDDNKDSADTFAGLIRLDGHEVKVTYDGKQAVALAGTARFDVVMLDLAMPKHDGYRVAEEIHREPACGKPVVIAVSGFSDEDHRQRWENAGFNEYLVKPVDPKPLFALLRRIGKKPAT